MNPAPVRFLLPVILLASAAVALAAPASAAEPEMPATTAKAARVSDPDTVPPDQRDSLLPKDWRTSTDLAWTTTGDSTGLHLLVARSSTGYTWRTVATLIEPGLEADQWIGNACLTGSGNRAVVVYAPRSFTNRQLTFDRGGFAAVVNLANGTVTKLGLRVSLAYHNPGCGTGETVVLAQSGVNDLGRTRLSLLDAASGSVSRLHELPGQVTSAVPLGDRIVAAGAGGLIEIDRGNATRVLASTSGTPFDIHPDRAGGIAYLEREGETGVVKHLSRGTPRELARGPLTGIGLIPGGDGTLLVTGEPTKVAALPGTVKQVKAPVGAGVSTQGAISFRHGTPRSAKPGQPFPVRLNARVTATGKELTFDVQPVPQRIAASATAPSAGIAGSPTDPVEAEATCAVPRNDSRTQVEQPHWKQVEWAADLAVRGALTVQRPYNWKHSGLPAWTPQGMYPRIGLVSPYPNGRVPAAIMMGILAQESNLWQASWHALEGVTGNPLIGRFYGNLDPNDLWKIQWGKADCGYGVAQVTDGMRKGDPSRTPTQQRAIAVDYATNIAAGLRILESKWNQTYNAGITVNDADPSNIENWFAAVWAYNTGMNPQASTGNTSGCTPSPTCTDSRGNWGLGWGNNPANPDYRINRKPFLESDPADAKFPQFWPYPEKVIGWAAFPIVKYDFRTDVFEAGYSQAWWTRESYRTDAKPPLDAFCSTAPNGNRCDINNPARCLEADFHCWWHLPVAWKPGCVDDDGGSVEYICGFDSYTYAPGSPEPPGGTHYAPVCDLTGLPHNGITIVDNVKDDVGIVRPGCAGNMTQGSFDLTFGADVSGNYPSKMDFHQIGSGFDGHFYFAHTWDPDAVNNRHKVTGTWTLNQHWANAWARVLVHLPSHGAQAQQARYEVDTGAGSPSGKRFKTRHVNTAGRWFRYDEDSPIPDNRWVSLGAFLFNGTPKVSLNNFSPGGDGTLDIAWDAVAFQWLPYKPRHVVTVLGDSYTSGEGVSENHRQDYYSETDSGAAGNRNACHRAYDSWARISELADSTFPIGNRADTHDVRMDYHMVACSGAQTENLLPSSESNSWGQSGTGAFGEASQIEQGYLDEHTTLVALSIGGNDANWSGVIQHCAMLVPFTDDCRNSFMPGDTLPLKFALPLMITNKLIPSIEKVLNQIRQRADGARIILMGYPRIISLYGACLASPYSFTPSEVQFFDEMADLIAQRMRELTERLDDQYPVTFSDPRSVFENKGVCGIPETIHGVITGKTPGENPDAPISQQSFHPKKTGARLYADAFEATLRSVGL